MCSNGTFGPQKSLNLISCNKWVIEKFWNFHTVWCLLFHLSIQEFFIRMLCRKNDDKKQWRFWVEKCPLTLYKRWKRFCKVKHSKKIWLLFNSVFPWCEILVNSESHQKNDIFDSLIGSKFRFDKFVQLFKG